LKIAENGIIQKLTIEPSTDQGKQVYQATINTNNLVLYHKGNEWKRDDSHNLNQE
jgi:hypothetical protein